MTAGTGLRVGVIGGAATALLGKYHRIRLETESRQDATEWNRCNTVEGCPDPKPNGLVNQMLAWMAQDRPAGDHGARQFLKEHEDAWPTWVSPQAVTAIKTAL